MTVDNLHAAVADHALQIAGICQTDPTDGLGNGTIVLLGPNEPHFWSTFVASPEYMDGQPNSMDRWSTRNIGALADKVAGRALYPFGQPARPFLTWALRSGECWASPVGLLVHRKYGLLVSFRGAILVKATNHNPVEHTSPCETCETKPCLTACPVGALTDKGYDLRACHDFLDAAEGKSCLSQGCTVRMSCPLSQSVGRAANQSAFHMASFHPGTS